MGSLHFQVPLGRLVFLEGLDCQVVQDLLDHLEPLVCLGQVDSQVRDHAFCKQSKNCALFIP